MSMYARSPCVVTLPALRSTITDNWPLVLKCVVLTAEPLVINWVSMRVLLTYTAPDGRALPMISNSSLRRSPSKSAATASLTRLRVGTAPLTFTGEPLLKL